jgi:hypothetical protein
MGCGSSRAIYVRGSVRRRIHIEDVRRLPYWDELLCIGCGTPLSYSRGGPTIAACFRHLPSTPQEIKDHCKYYLGGESDDDDDIGSSHRMSFVLDVDRNNRRQQWRLFVRLPQIDGAIGEGRLVGGTHGHVRRIDLSAVAATPKDYATYPNVRRLRLEAADPCAEDYVESLASATLKISDDGIYIFPETRSSRSAAASKVQFGAAYYIVRRMGQQLPKPLQPVVLKTDASNEDFRGWECSYVAFPDAANDEIARWLWDKAKLEFCAPYCKLEVLYPPRLSSEYSDAISLISRTEQIIVAFERPHANAKTVLAYSEDVTQSAYIDLGTALRGAVTIPASYDGHMALGFCNREGDANWQVLYHLRPIADFDPPVASFRFSPETEAADISTLDGRLQQYFDDTRAGRRSIVGFAAPPGSTLVLLTRSVREVDWSAPALAELKTGTLNRLVRDNSTELKLEVGGVTVVTLRAPFVAEPQAARAEQHLPWRHFADVLRAPVPELAATLAWPRITGGNRDNRQ